MLRSASIVLIALLFTACATNENKSSTSAPATTNTAKTTPTPTPAAEPCKKGKKCPAEAPQTKGNVQKVMSKDGDFEGEIVGNIAPSSKFAKLKIGMSRRQTEDLIGQPSDTKTYATGKAWTPFYFGNDTVRQETFYKKEGRLTFAKNGEKLFRISVDTTEDGYQ